MNILDHIPSIIEPLIDKSKLSFIGYIVVGTVLVLIVPMLQLLIGV